MKFSHLFLTSAALSGVQQLLADAIAAASRDGELQQKIRAQGIKPDIVALDAFDSYVDGDLARLAPLTKGIVEKP